MIKAAVDDEDETEVERDDYQTNSARQLLDVTGKMSCCLGTTGEVLD